MKQPSEQNFNQYKTTEIKALEILSEMKKTGGSKVDIELALLVAIFELHKGSVSTDTISNIIKGHLNTLEPYYGSGDLSKN